jgi:lysophospholipase L1-like esterase
VDLQHQIYRWDEMSDAFQTVSKLADAHGLSVWVFVYPTWPSAGWNEYPTEGYAVVDDLVARFDALGFDTLDLVEVFRREPPSRYRMSADDPWHPNASGHQLMAGELARWLVPKIATQSSFELGHAPTGGP